MIRKGNENTRNREWAQKMLEAICKEGARLVEKDNATSITYHIKIGTECARFVARRPRISTPNAQPGQLRADRTRCV